uniref:Thrombospondin-like N-terminal domain-containing protein n=1 Tax=Ciona intestinalis TaxID=7719 RepID=F6ZSI5_CIOIN
TGVEIFKEGGVTGYRFDPEARLLGVNADVIMTSCNFFPREFSLVVTFRREIPRSENEYLMTLVGQDRHTVLVGLRLQRNSLNFELVGRSLGERRNVRYEDARFNDGEWHTVVMAVAGSKVKFTIDCMTSSTSGLIFPQRMSTRGARLHIASRRKKRGRFTGVLRQLKFIAGSDVTRHLCPTSSHTSYPDWFGVQVYTSKIMTSEATTKVVVDDDITMTCTSDNKGQLMYRKQDGDVTMCQEDKWMTIASTQPKLDYVIEHGSLLTKSKTLDIEVFEVAGEGTFLAAANQGRDRNMASTIYKWESDTKRFVAYQDIATETARHFEFFTIESEQFLAVANHEVGNSPTAVSAIYRWNHKRRRFVPHQFIRTFAARNWESFQVDGKFYLVVANYAGDNGQKETSWVYMWNPDHRAFIKYQALQTIGAYDVEHFQIGADHYLAVANSFNGVKTKLDSVIYRWRHSNFVPFQYIETFGATDWEYFVISGRHFIAVANYYDNSPDRVTYVINSFIFEFQEEINQFVKIQEIPTQGARDIEVFEVGSDSFLVSASASDEHRNHKSVIYRWQGMEHFVPVHTVPIGPCADWEAFRTSRGEYYLVSANVISRTSAIMRMLTY